MDMGIRSDKLARLLKELPVGVRDEFKTLWQRRSVKAGEVLARDGEELSHIGYVLDGLLGMAKMLPDGRRHIVGLLAPGDMYGRAFDGAMAYQIEALSDTIVQVCSRQKFEDILGRSPEAERLFLIDILDELDAAREWVQVLGGRKVSHRVAAFLLILCRQQARGCVMDEAEDDPVSLHLKIRRADLARYLGTRTESLSRAFNGLQRDGVIRIKSPYDFEVLDLAGLVEHAGLDLVTDGPD